MKITKAYINKVVKQGNWIIRGDNDGVSHGGFRWKPLGEWTEAPDWNERSECGGGLHGQDINYGGMFSGNRVVFCETKGKHIVIGYNKVKVRYARILMVGLPKIPKINGSLDLSGCDLSGITLPTSVGGSIYR